jgi:hypothetical protein
VCEGHGFDEQTCQQQGYSYAGPVCCQWDDGACWSNVGPNPCFGDQDDDDEEDGASMATPAMLLLAFTSLFV